MPDIDEPIEDDATGDEVPGPVDLDPGTDPDPDADTEDVDVDVDVDADLGAGAGGDADVGTEGEGAPRKRRARPLSPVPPDRLVGAIEALLVASGDVLSADRLRDLLGLPSVLPVREGLAALEARWRESGAAVELQEVAGGFRAATRPEYAEYVRRLSRRPAVDRLTPSLLETLSIVAYRQPVARVEVERIRGVQAGEALRALLDRRLIKVTGRSDQPGRPLLYGTTRRFLEAFGLGTLKDLPSKGDLKRL